MEKAEKLRVVWRDVRWGRHIEIWGHAQGCEGSVTRFRMGHKWQESGEAQGGCDGVCKSAKEMQQGPRRMTQMHENVREAW